MISAPEAEHAAWLLSGYATRAADRAALLAVELPF
jgi:hypothetical protein